MTALMDIIQEEIERVKIEFDGNLLARYTQFFMGFDDENTQTSWVNTSQARNFHQMVCRGFKFSFHSRVAYVTNNTNDLDVWEKHFEDIWDRIEKRMSKFKLKGQWQNVFCCMFGMIEVYRSKRQGGYMCWDEFLAERLYIKFNGLILNDSLAKYIEKEKMVEAIKVAGFGQY